MEVSMDLSTVFDQELVKLDFSSLRRLSPRRNPVISKMIDEIGRLSSQAQQMRRRVLTTYDKFVEAENQTLYILWHKSYQKEKSSVFLGYLKVGRKQLYLYDAQMHNRQMNPKKLQCRQANPVCILDFYIHFSRQRQGYGHRLFDFMLKTEGINAAEVAIDKPSDSLLSFMKKHYNLTDPIWQNTNYVVYPKFFEILDNPREFRHASPPPVAPAVPISMPEPPPEPVHAKETTYNHYQEQASATTKPSSPKRPMSGSMAPTTDENEGLSKIAHKRMVASMGHQPIW